MNIFFKIAGKVVTPSLNGSILPGITRNSVIQVCKDWGYEVEERLLPVDELFAAAEEGRLEEAFGSGTAAVVSPIGQMGWEEHHVTICNGEIGPLTHKLYDTLTGIQMGRLKAPEGWIQVID